MRGTELDPIKSNQPDSKSYRTHTTPFLLQSNSFPPRCSLIRTQQGTQRSSLPLSAPQKHPTSNPRARHTLSFPCVTNPQPKSDVTAFVTCVTLSPKTQKSDTGSTALGNSSTREATANTTGRWQRDGAKDGGFDGTSLFTPRVPISRRHHARTACRWGGEGRRPAHQTT